MIEQLSKSDLPCDQLELRLKKKELANIEAAYYALKEPEKATAFEEAKQRVKAIPIDSLFKSVHRKGSRLAVTLCIFHEEGTPSLTLYLKKNNAYCYGCKKYADPIEVLMKLHNLTFNEVLNQYGH